MSTFTCPVDNLTPAVGMESGDRVGNRLFKFYGARSQYIGVFYLSDGTFAQTSAGGFAPNGTAIANKNVNIPYPYDPNDPDGPYSTSYYLNQVVTLEHDPYIVKLYQGASTVTAEEVALLTAAGYGACIS